MQALLEVAQRLFGVERYRDATVSWRVSEMPEKQLVVRDHIAIRAIVEIVDRRRIFVGAADRFIDLTEVVALLDHLAFHVEYVNIDFGALFERLAGDVPIDTISGNGTMADGGGEQMRLDDVAADENARLAGDLIIFVRRNRSLAIVEFFQAGKIDRLTDRGHDQIGRDIFLGAFNVFDVQAPADQFGFTANDTQPDRTAVVGAQHFDRCQPAANGNALGHRLLDLVLVGLHLVDVEDRRQRHLGTKLGGDFRHIVSDISQDGRFRTITFMGAIDVPKSTRDRGDVNRGVATADDHDAFTDVLHAAIVKRTQE